MPSFQEFTGEQRRQIINTQQAFDAWRAVEIEKRRRFSGGMRWGARNGQDYLLRKQGSSERSLGKRGPETEATLVAFLEGRARNKSQTEGLSQRLDALAPVNRAMRLGRVPRLAAGIARQCDRAGVLGEQLFIVGTNALFAYEALAGIAFNTDILATDDIDLLFDARSRLSMALRGRLREAGLIGMLRKVDKSFALTQKGSYRAVNRDAYMVDLIQPPPKDMAQPAPRRSLIDANDDLEGAEIFGLNWLINAPKVETVVIDERGYPAPFVVVDPRVFAAHKFWLSDRIDRSPLKRRRDREQALAAAEIAVRHLQLDPKGPDLSAMPHELRARLLEFSPTTPPDAGEPNW